VVVLTGFHFTQEGPIPQLLKSFLKKADLFKFPPYNMVPKEAGEGDYPTEFFYGRCWCPFDIISVDKGKVTPTLWTTLAEILQNPTTGSHRILRRSLFILHAAS